MSAKADGGGLSFNYKKLPNGLLRPLIRIEVSSAKTVDGIPCEVLVDSGADFCILKAEIGEILGLDIKSGQESPYRGINGTESVGYAHTVWLSVKDIWFSAKVVFSYEIPKGGHQVVGQVGFFDHFKVNFDYQKASIVLRPK